MPKKKAPKVETLPFLNRLAKARLQGTLTEDNFVLLTLANKLGITHANVDFNGSGDSGDIEQPTLRRPRIATDPVRPWESTQSELVDVDPKRIDYVKVGDDESGMYYTPDGRFNSVASPNPEYTSEHSDLERMVKTIADDKVENCGVDWYNNEGGGGHVTFDLTTGKVDFYVYANEIVVSHEETTSYDLFDDTQENI
jgi:hypothetical protein